MINAEAGYPTVIDKEGREYKVYGWGVHMQVSSVYDHGLDVAEPAPSGILSGTGWEWYALEPIDGDVAYGFVHGFEDEFGSFSISELKENGVYWTEDPAKLRSIAPPVGWEWKKKRCS